MDFDYEIKQLEGKIEKLKRDKDGLEILTPMQRAAIEYHDLTCTWNHTDGCFWHYEIHNGKHNWSGPAHRSALEAIINVYNINADFETFIKQLKAAKGR